jgi:adenylate kinase
MQPKTYVFFGNIGAGKGTQIELLQKLIQEAGRHVIYFSPGVEYRAAIASGSYSGSVIKSVFEAGKLLPDVLTSGLFTGYLMKDLTPETTIIADGYPRSTQQSDDFIALMEFYGRTDIEIINIDITKEEAVKRMQLRKRADDTPEGIASRFEVYEKSVVPSLEVLKQKGYTLHTVAGDQTVEAVHADIKKALGL